MKSQNIDMKQIQNILFITYFLKRNDNHLEVIFKGCREIVSPVYDLPSYVKGVIKIERECILVIDPSIYFRGRQSEPGNLACILITEYTCGCCNHRMGVIIEDLDDIMNLAACSVREITLKAFTFNMNFIVNAFKNGTAKQFLSNTQKLFDMHEKRESVSNSSFVKNHGANTKNDKTELDEFEIFHTNEFLVTI